MTRYFPKKSIRSAAVSDSAPTTSLPGFDGLYGLEMLEITDEIARARVRVRDQLKQPMGLVHGGVYAAIAGVLGCHGELERACQALVDAANGAGGPDNITALLVRID